MGIELLLAIFSFLCLLWVYLRLDRELHLTKIEVIKAINDSRNATEQRNFYKCKYGEIDPVEFWDWRVGRHISRLTKQLSKEL